MTWYSISVVASTGALSVASWAPVVVPALGYYFDALHAPYVMGVVIATDTYGRVAEANLKIAVLDVSDPPQFALIAYSANVLARSQQISLLCLLFCIQLIKPLAFLVYCSV